MSQTGFTICNGSAVRQQCAGRLRQFELEEDVALTLRRPEALPEIHYLVFCSLVLVCLQS
jgi:hypothetical protein